MFSEEDLDEAPIDVDFFSNNHVVTDMDEDDDCVVLENTLEDEDPLDINPSPSSRPAKTTAPPPKLLPIPTPSDSLPVISLLTPPPNAIRTYNASLPPEYANMTFEDYKQDMCRSICDIVQECIGLFSRDPFEYHPFYLRVYKYVTIGQRLGYILPVEATDVTTLWAEFSDFASNQYKASKEKNVCYNGERSPYATYVITKKVVIGGKVIPQNTTEQERNRKFEQIETEARDIRKRWEGNAKRGDNIRDNLSARLEFCKACVVMTNPADTVKMNNLWSRFLSKDGFKMRGRNTGGGWEKIVARVQNKDDDSSTKPLFIKIIKPSTPAHSPSPSPPISPSPASPVEPCSPCDLSEADEPVPPKKHKPEPKSVILEQGSAKQVLKSKKSRSTTSGVIPTRKLASVSYNLLKKKRLQLKNRIAKCTNPSTSTSRLVQLEKLINKRKADLLAVRKKKCADKILKSTEASHLKSKPLKPTHKRIVRQMIKKNYNGKDSSHQNASASPPNHGMDAESIMSNTGGLSSSPMDSEDVKQGSSTKDVPATEKCDHCHRWFSPSYMEIHKEAAHNQKRQIKCPMCPLQLTTPRSAWYHFCSKHLADCNLAHLDPASLLPTVPTTENPKPTLKRNLEPMPSFVPCEHCGKMIHFCSLDRHIRFLHSEDQTPNYFQCPHCPKQYKGRDWLEFHIKKDHEGSVKVNCPECNRDLQAPGKLWRHMIDRHGISLMEAAEFCKVTVAQCVYCGKDLLAGRQLHKHVRTEHAENLEEFLAGEILRKEQQDLTGEKDASARPRHGQYASSKERKRIQRQRMREEGIGPAWLQREFAAKGKQSEVQNKCPVDTTSKRPKVRNKCLVDETDKRPEVQYACPVESCEVVLANETYLKRHLRTYHSTTLNRRIVERRVVKVVEKTKTYIVMLCTLCNQYQFTFEEMKAHLVSCHTSLFDGLEPEKAESKAKEVACPHCDQRFTDDKEKRSHVEASHLEMCWRCPQCDKLVLDSDDLEKHFKEDHVQERIGAVSDDEDDNAGFLQMKTLGEVYYRKKPKETSVELRLDVYNIPVQCEICEKQTSIGNLNRHVETAHEVQEDGNLYPCNLCNDHTSYKKRLDYLIHMKKYHASELGEAGMAELIAKASKINTKVNWRDLEVKNPGGTRKRWTKKGKNLRTKEKPLKKKLKLLKKKPQRIRRKPAASSSDNDNSDVDFEPVEIKKSPARRFPQRSCVKLRNIEKFKRLTISLVRLTEEELSKYLGRPGKDESM